MEPEIIAKDSFPVIGIELKTTTQDGRNFAEIPQFWQQVMKKGQIARIPDRKDPQSLLGICTDFESGGGFSYIIGAEVTTTENTPDDMVSRMIPAARYAVFTARGQLPDSIQDVTRYIYNEWLPNSEFQRANLADFELYDERMDDDENAAVDIYVPIVAR